MKKALIVLLGIVLVFTAGIFSLRLWASTLVKSETDNIYMNKLDVSMIKSDMYLEDWGKAYGFSVNEVADILSSPEKYREITVEFEAQNKYAIEGIGIECHHMRGLTGKPRLALSDNTRMDLSRGYNSEMFFSFFIQYNGETDQEILANIKNSQLYITDFLFLKWRIAVGQDEFTPQPAAP